MIFHLPGVFSIVYSVFDLGVESVVGMTRGDFSPAGEVVGMTGADFSCDGSIPYVNS